MINAQIRSEVQSQLLIRFSNVFGFSTLRPFESDASLFLFISTIISEISCGCDQTTLVRKGIVHVSGGLFLAVD